MILTHPLFSSPFEFKENKIMLLVIENKAYYRRIIDDFRVQLLGIDGESKIFCDDKELKLNKHVELITDFFNIDINKNKNLTRLYTAIKEEYINSDNYSKYLKLSESILSFMNEVNNNFDYDLSYDEQIELSTLLKAINLKFVLEEKIFNEKVMDYLSLMNTYLQIKLFIFANIKSVMNIQELEELYQFLIYKKIPTLFIESQVGEFNKYEKIRIGDQDLCVID